MKFYVKPSMNVIELQLNENIAAVPTTVFKGASRAQAEQSAARYDMALTSLGSGTQNDYANS